ncbi:MAG: phosphatase PAP2 family protein, partial [Gammaproteobacteria bacterium]|nr:phosphatase PAP2 family protein [Gammaproteobacteria bacterium]
KYKRWTQFIVAVLVFGIAVSRLYLGAHWLTDVVGSTLLGSTLLLFFIIAYRRKAMEPIPIWSTLLVLIVSFAVIYGCYAWFYYPTLLQDYQMVPAPSSAVMMPAAIFV